MRIIVRQPFLPFSLEPGARCLIPLTTWEAQIFPSKAFLYNLRSRGTVEMDLPFGGKFQGFKVTLNLERGRVEVRTKQSKPLYLTKDSHPQIEKAFPTPTDKRLSLGVHKKQDWDLMRRRCDMAEIFPLWLKMAEWIPKVSLPKKIVGTMHLLKPKALVELFLAGFEGILCPRLSDPRYLGLIDQERIPSNACPIGLIHEGARLIESLFFQEEGDELYLLPCLPPSFHTGRFVHLKTALGDRLDIEWSKKMLKKAIFYPALERKVTFKLQSRLKGFRVRRDLRNRGQLVKKGEAVHVKPHQVVYCDRFVHS